MRTLLEAHGHCADIRDETIGRRLGTFLALQMHSHCASRTPSFVSTAFCLGSEARCLPRWAKAVPLFEDLESLKLNRLTIH
jgi:hypothetical protein